MQKKTGFALGTFLLAFGFVWVVFDNIALGLLFGLIAGGAAGKAAKASAADEERDRTGGR